MNIDTVAEAIRQAARNVVYRESIDWHKCARAAIDSLQLTEETRHCQKIGLDSHARSGPLQPAGDMRTESRLVTPWVES